jgi:hypothetical protein
MQRKSLKLENMVTFKDDFNNSRFYTMEIGKRHIEELNVLNKTSGE